MVNVMFSVLYHNFKKKKHSLEWFTFQPEEQNPVGLQSEEGRPAGHQGQATTVGSPMGARMYWILVSGAAGWGWGEAQGSTGS